MKCHAGIEFPNGADCPKCGARLGEVCWPGINADLIELPKLRDEVKRLRSVLIGIAEYCSGEDRTLGAVTRLASVHNTALQALRPPAPAKINEELKG